MTVFEDYDSIEAAMSMFVIGDENTILGFALVGVEGEIVGSGEQARQSLDRALRSESIEIVLITESWADQLRERVNEIRVEGTKPLVLEIPGSDPAPQGPSLRELVERAVGIRLGVEQEA